MKVRCTRLEDAFGNPYPGTRSNSLTVGQVYHVLEIYCTEADMSYRILADGGAPVIKFAKSFDIIEPDVPDFWKVSITGTDEPSLRIGPEEWDGDFWVRYFNLEKSARAAFKRQLQRTIG